MRYFVKPYSIINLVRKDTLWNEKNKTFKMRIRFYVISYTGMTSRNLNRKRDDISLKFASKCTLQLTVKSSNISITVIFL